MKKLEIISQNNIEYKLKEENGNIYSINLEFLDMEQTPKKGDIIYITEELLNPKYEGYSTNYAFGNLDSIYGKKNIAINDIDVIKVKIEEKEIYLKRLYG